MNIQEQSELLAKEVVKVQEEDLLQVMNDLGMNINEALEKLRVIHHKQDGRGVEYTIMGTSTLEVYKNRKIDFNFFGNYEVFK